MKVEVFMLSEISLTHKKTNIVWFNLYEVCRVVKLIETESRVVVARVWEGQGDGAYRVNEYRVCFAK